MEVYISKLTKGRGAIVLGHIFRSLALHFSLCCFWTVLLLMQRTDLFSLLPGLLLLILQSLFASSVSGLIRWNDSLGLSALPKRHCSCESQSAVVFMLWCDWTVNSSWPMTSSRLLVVQQDYPDNRGGGHKRSGTRSWVSLISVPLVVSITDVSYFCTTFFLQLYIQWFMDYDLSCCKQEITCQLCRQRFFFFKASVVADAPPVNSPALLQLQCLWSCQVKQAGQVVEPQQTCPL